MNCTAVIKGGAWMYPGGASLAAPGLLKIFPPHTRYIEPFVGAGAVYWQHPLCGISEVVLNDKDPAVFRIWNDIKSGELARQLSDFGCLIVSRELAKKAMQSSNSLMRIAGWRMTFASQRENTSVKVGLQLCFDKLRRNLPTMQAKLRAVPTVVRGLDYSQLLPAYDQSGTFFFLDPPWPNVPNIKAQYEFWQMDWKRYVRSLAALKLAKFLHYSKWDEQLAERCVKAGFRVVHLARRRALTSGLAGMIGGGQGMEPEAQVGYMLSSNYKVRLP